MKRLIYILPAVGFIVLAVVLYRSLFMAPTILPSALINKPAPRLTLPALDAQTQGFGPKELAGGHVSVVNVFASWCIPCHVEAPVLMQLAAMRDKDRFEIYGFVQRDTPDKIRAFLAQAGNPFSRIGNDVDGRAGIEWGVYGAPETFVVDGKGVIRYKYTGPLTPDVLKNELLPAIHAAAGS
ncbi:MAG TPA: DsbE family thiol:disulfide interchange protein [Acidisoma sp.]|jgi:cytochrome c biogenesis protein CcmG/thiol:disulfide interchange protein DsbE|uniref:DsbE family thiol:disulfide interchange protein n=1 Tax=Acidisoma sp. TaxID=1872115 RepID=UPI002BE553E7|nr:DsbE family thiol:disulfide interchange protein [Acidisoma sp.]HTI01836.1 DsbE family thiol:disulfide interchange protein [Acidisoma sp.]